MNRSKDLKRKSKMNSNLVDVYNNRGVAYFMQNKLTRAISNFTKAIGINSRYSSAYYNRAITYSLLKEYDNAWADAHKAEKLGSAFNPEFINVLKKALGKDK